MVTNKDYSMISEELAQIIKVVKEAGAAIMTIYDRVEGQDDLTIKSKEDHSPLTEADLAAHHCIIEGLKNIDPETPIISEESTLPTYQERSEWTRFWLVDPLDGTKEFIKRNGEFTVNIALIEHNVPTKGVVYAPALNLLYFAEANSGSFKQIISPKHEKQQPPVQIYSRKAESNQPLTLVESRSHGSQALEDYIIENNLQISSHVASGSSLKICLVAEGKADIYPRLGPTMEWDVAAGDAIYRYSGKEEPHSSELVFNKENLLNPSFVYGF